MKLRAHPSTRLQARGFALAGSLAIGLALFAPLALPSARGPSAAALGATKESSRDKNADWLTHEDPSAPAAKRAGPFPNRPQDQLWVVSCRGAPSAAVERATSRLRYWQYQAPGQQASGQQASGQQVSGQQASGQWLPSDRDSFVAASIPSSTSCVFVAGNGYTDAETRALGRSAYLGLSRGLSAETPLRFVIWSWPSDRTDAAVIQDLRIKAARTDRVAWHLAEWLNETAAGLDCSLIGASFGVRVAGGALHLLGGGRLGGYALTQRNGSLAPMPVLFISPAIDNDWLLPGHRFGRAMSQVERLLLVNNSSDRMLKRYHWLYGRRSPAEALGHSGLVAASRFGDDREKISQFDAAAVIGPQHGCGPYFQSSALAARMRAHLIESGSSAPTMRGHSMPAAYSGNQSPAD
ncbi:MAG TPA: hypothetical protein VGN42_05080 [Pirellulales bacterium]|jgi:hypothetical protein|nr:hypothetical protein [Pirellulales bacterium]